MPAPSYGSFASARTPLGGERARRGARDRVDWRAVYRDAVRVGIRGGQPHEAATFVVPFDESRELVVVMVPCPRTAVRRLRGALEVASDVIRGTGGLLALIGGKR
jgi:hypothetical protein